MQFDQSILSQRELLFFEFLKKHEKVSADELVLIVKKYEFKEVKRQSVIVCIKYLQSKIAEHGWIIERVSGIGAGKVGVYRMTEKF